MLLTFPFKWDLLTIFRPYDYDVLLNDRFNFLTNTVVEHHFNLNDIKNMDNVEFEYYTSKLIEITKENENKKIEDTIQKAGGIIDE